MQYNSCVCSNFLIDRNIGIDFDNFDHVVGRKTVVMTPYFECKRPMLSQIQLILIWRIANPIKVGNCNICIDFDNFDYVVGLKTVVMTPFLNARGLC